jgi:hypothetical protein
MILVALVLTLGACPAFAALPAGKHEAQWKQVDEAVNKGLPKTAIERINPLIEEAMRDKDYPEAIRAIAKKIALEGIIQGNKPEEKITRMDAEIAKAPKEMAPVMEAILANWYWHYFQQNRWRFMRRTGTAQAPGKDFTTWDLPRLFAEIDKHYTQALAAEAELKKTAIAQYDGLLEKGTMPDSYRPTLYDFVAQEALTFYTSGEQAAAKPEDAFELAAGSPIFAPADEFLAWKLESSDSQSPLVKAILLYQEILRFHQKDTDQAAFLDANLARLVLGYNKAVGEEKAARYKAALKHFVDRFGDHEVSAQARYHWALVLQQEGNVSGTLRVPSGGGTRSVPDTDNLVEAHRLAEQGARAFPETAGGKLCYNLQQQIEAKSSAAVTERVWTEPWPKIQVRYRNVSKVYFRAVRDDWLAWMNTSRGQPEWLDDGARRALLVKKPDLAWSQDLPATADYRERTEELPAPKDLKPGFYYLLASHDANFSEADNVVSFTDFWVSSLALVLRTRWGDTQMEGFVLDANSGEPIEGAQVQIYARDWNGGLLTGGKGQTDRNGLFSLAAVNQRGNLAYVAFKDQQLASANQFYAYGQAQQPPRNTRTIFFSDRSLYRPGQTIQYKGLVIEVDTAGNNYKVLPGETLTVVFADVNGQEVSRQQVRSNDYGSFSGSVTAPRDRLAGRMTLRIDGPHQGATQFNVEEYKRPKFQVTLEAPKVAAKLDGTTRLEGKAIGYSGAAVGGGRVRYRVVRQVRYPDWWFWCFWWRMPQNTSQEIAHGTAVTEPDGSFAVEFPAKPDLSVSEKDEPVFDFTVYADVTDTTGETRSAERSIRVGYTALRAALSAPEWLVAGKPFDVSLKTETLDGEPARAEGALKIYRLKQPAEVERASLFGPPSSPRPSGEGPGVRGRNAGAGSPSPQPSPGGRGGPPVDPSNPNSWELGEVVAEEGLTTDFFGKAAYSAKLAGGPYRAKFETQDRFGKKVVAWLPLQVLAPEAKVLPIKIPNLVAAPKWELEPGEELSALWGSGYAKARAYVEIEHRQKIIKSFWTEPGASQQPVKLPVTEDMRGGFFLRVSMVRENRAYLTSRRVEVPWSNKKLSLRWEHFVSKLEPAQKETWTAVISGPDAKRAVAEMVAALYDKSLDAYLPHNWLHGIDVFYQDYSRVNTQFENTAKQFQHMLGRWPSPYKSVQITYRALPGEITAHLWGYMYRDGQGFGRGPGMPPMMSTLAAAQQNAAGVPMAEAKGAMNGMFAERALAAGEDKPGAAGRESDKAKKAAEQERQHGGQGPGAAGAASAPDLSKVSARQNLNETAFFFPHLVSDKEGLVKLEFTMPEALTEWKFLGLAHDRELRSGYLEDKVVTAKDIMVQPNPPRFLREGDVLEFTVKVSNQSATRQAGRVRLTLANARTARPVDEFLGNTETDRDFDIPTKQSQTFAWRLEVPDGAGTLAYKAVAATGRISDGEEGFLPVLARRILVTESLPLPIRGPAIKRFDFARLRAAGQSKTLRSQSLTVQMVSNPAWYAVMALPYLMEFPYECTEQTFNRLYANSLARHIANSDPKIRRVFEQWKQPPAGTRPALQSPLEQNQDLKSVLLEETPWVRQAQAEKQARQNVGILFDENRLNDETARLMKKLAEQQLGDGAWPWFPGGPPNDYITLYITTGFGRLRHLGVKLDVAPAVKSLGRLDQWIDQTYRDILRWGHKEDNHLSSTIALYLYGRSFFLEDRPVAAAQKEAVDYFLGQARKYWLALACRQSQAHLAVALKRFGDKTVPMDIARSISERSVSTEELGMFWRDTELSWWWYRAPIETQAMMIEMFDEVANDAKAVEECKVWLLKQKQTQDWKTSKATADAVYALLLRGAGVLASDELVEVLLGANEIKPEQVEAGTGFYEHRFLRTEITPDMGRITVRKLDQGVAWGSVHWQYLEDMNKVTPYEGTPLRLAKSLYIRQMTKKGPLLEPVARPLAVGDELVVRIVLRTDRDMEYVHLKDHRASGTEPANVLSQYKYQDGLAYYESTRDTASHFFIDYLPKGTYVFEYATRVVHKGQYQTGMASIQCMYAPEFNSHSESLLLEVK